MSEINSQEKNNILNISRSEQYRTVEELFQKSSPNSMFYTFLILSVFIIAPGLLLNNGFIVVGGMIIAPVLTPVLVIALALAVGELKAMRSAAMLLVKSCLLILLISMIVSLVFLGPSSDLVFENTMRTAALYFIIAIASGSAATFAWARKELSDSMAGIAIALSLVPPLSLVGIKIMSLHSSQAQFYFLVFFFNLIGVIVGSLITFSLLKFYKSGQKVQQEIKQQEQEHKQEQGQKT